MRIYKPKKQPIIVVRMGSLSLRLCETDVQQVHALLLLICPTGKNTKVVVREYQRKVYGRSVTVWLEDSPEQIKTKIINACQKSQV
jgi:hypothetical protein